MAEEELALNRNIRRGQRAATTRILGQVGTAVDTQPPNGPKISQLKRSLEEKLQILSNLDDKILVVTPGEDIETEIIQADEVKERIFLALLQLDAASNLPPRPATPAAIDEAPGVEGDDRRGTDAPAVVVEVPRIEGDATDGRRGTDGVVGDMTLPAPTEPDPPTPPAASHGAKVRLPKISLPRFRGDPVKWTPFWDAYKSAIHLNPDLSEIDKFNYLRSLLDHTALDAITGLALSTANYQQAIEILEKRFGNKQVIISKHMDALMNLETITSDRNLRELRRLYDQTESHVRSLKALGIEPDSYGALLSPVLLAKLPPDLRLIVSRKVSQSSLEMEALLTNFEEELIARERANPQASRRPHDRPSPSSALFSGSRGSKTEPQCSYCQQSHPSSTCSSVITLTDRRNSLKTSGRCFNCLRRGHVARTCKSSSRCLKCKKRHHTSICDDGQSQPQPSPSSNASLNPGAAPFQSSQPTSTLCSGSRQAVFLQTARAVIHHPFKPHVSLEVRLILDGGSQKSYISQRVCDVLNLAPVGEQTLSIATFGSSKGTARVCPIVNVGMCMRGYPSMFLSLYVMPTICEPLVGQPIATCVEQYPHLAGLELADESSGSPNIPVDLLVGSDYYWHLVTGNTRRGLSGPVAVHTRLGWVLSGPMSQSDPDSNPEPSVTNLNVHVLHAESQPIEACTLKDQLRSFWELESLGIREKEETLYDEFASVVKFKNGRYEVPLPWKEFHDPLPTNYQLSMSRLRGLLRRLKQEPTVLKEYDRIIQEQLKRGIIEAVPSSEAPPKTTHYLPHHAVIRQDKSTTKVRVVYDASAKSPNSPSLNDCLLKGPKFNQLIFDLLVRFRSHKIALTADLEKAFLMISVKEADRDVLRFIWTNDVLKDPPELTVYRFTRVVFGVSSSPFLLNATIQFHLERYLGTNEHLVRQLLRSTYVDDIVSGGKTEEEVFNLYSQSKEVFRTGGFNLRKFLTNSKPLQRKIDRLEDPSSATSTEQDDPTYSEATLGANPPAVGDHRVLGIPWNTESDQLEFDVAHLAKLAVELCPTRRNVVSLIGKFYDPLGFLSPVIIKFKMLFQRLCEGKADWDAVITGELLEEWRSLVVELNVHSPVSLPRSYLSGVEDPVTSATLCGFCDASSRAYAAVVYLFLKTESHATVRFVAAKTRVAPLQAPTIPRLELLSAFLLSKLIISVRDCLQHEMAPLSIQCYSDSQVALYWICGRDKEWKPFIQNRVKEIRRNVHPDLWSHCPGVSNPADLPSRGLTMMELSTSMLWRYGPDWLGQDPPALTDVTSTPMPKLCLLELKSTAKSSHNLLAAEKKADIGELIRCEDVSDLQRLLKVTAYVLRAVSRFKARRTTDSSTPVTLTSQEIAAAELLWASYAQTELVQQKGYEMLKGQLRLFADGKGLWRCGGRLQNADISYSAKYPILLPRNHHFTTLVVWDAHSRVCHNGVKETLTEIRSRYWIVKGRSLVRATLHKCTICRKFEGAPITGPPPPPLPEFRVRDDPAFTYTGVDFAGPLLVRNGSSKDGSKIWICLFTCLVTRAVHLDIVCSLATGDFLRCLKRFASRRGLPRKFLSDNGKTFRAAAKFLRAVFKDNIVQEHLARIGCQWVFNVEYAPWWGGVFERMVRSTKRCLRKMIGRASLTQDEMLTAIVEIEGVINSRPLSYICSSDVEEPLTPSHLIVGRRLLNLPDNFDCLQDPDDEDFEIDANKLTRRMKHLASVLNHFWRRWRSEYLSELRESHRYASKKTAQASNVKRGDVVIVHDDALPRGFWKLGRIQELFSGQDGLSRSALVRVATRERQHTLLKRPLQRLYPLEITNLESDKPAPSLPLTTEPELVPDQHGEGSDATEATRRPVRAAAKRGNERRRLWIQELQD